MGRAELAGWTSKRRWTSALLIVFILVVPLLLTIKTHAADSLVISSITPSSGLTSGGDSVTIIGSGFNETTRVYFGDDLAGSITLQSSEMITAVTPVGTAGDKDIIVKNDDGQSSVLESGYTYTDPLPVISSVSPSQGTTSGSQTVTITGQNLTVGVSQLSQVSTGSAHSCGIYDGRAYCWGQNGDGQLGNGTVNRSSIPVAVDASDALAGKTIRQISAGTSHTCAVTTDNAAYCWGLNTNGRTGLGVATGNQLTPRQISTIGSSVASIAAADRHTCAVTTEGRAYCWGDGYYGALGTGLGYSNAERTTPTAVTTAGTPLEDKTVTAIGTGGVGSNGFTCVIASDQQAYCWGYGGGGQMGNGTNANSNLKAVAVDNTGALVGKNLETITVGQYHACVIASDDQAYCWGSGFGTRPVLVAGGALAGKTVRSIAAGNASTCAVASDDQAYCWGTNSYGQLGNGTTNNSGTTPVAVDTTGVLAGKIIRAVSVGNAYVCAVTAGKEGYCWGLNNNGQLGNDSTTNSLTPIAMKTVPIAPLVVRFGEVEAAAVERISSTELKVITPAHVSGPINVAVERYDGEEASLAQGYTYIDRPENITLVPNEGLTSGGTAVTITGDGFTEGMQLEINGLPVTELTFIDGNTLTFIAPAWYKTGPVDLTLKDPYGGVVTLPASYTYRDPAPTISSISPNNGPTSGSQTVTITGQNLTVGASQLSQVSAGANHTCGIYDGAAYCWGLNTNGQLGNGTVNDSAVPVPVDTSDALAGKTIRQISAGTSHTCAVATDNTAYCWGLNSSGRTGFGVTSGNQLTPQQISTIGSSVTSIAAADSHTCAITTEHAAYCWGYGYYGALGTGASYSNAERNTPAAVSITGTPLEDKTVTAIGAGGIGSNGFTCAIASDQQAYCWGYGGNGQMGNGATANVNARAVAVDTTGALAGKTLKAIAVGRYHACVIASDDQAYCWGSGFGTRPVLVVGGALAGKTVRSISAGNASTCVVASDDRAYCWGTNTNGQLGNGTTTNSGTTPVAVDTTGALAGKIIRFSSVGNGYACVVTVNKEGYCWGMNTNGQFGNNSTDNSLTPVAMNTVPVAPLVVKFGEVGVVAEHISTTELKVVTPPHVSTVVDVAVERYDGETVTYPSGYSYTAKPEIAAAAPSTGLTTGGDVVTIYGNNFRSGATVRLNYNLINSVAYIDEHTLQIVMPPTNPGVKSIEVTNPDGQQTVLYDAYTAFEPAMTIDDILPDQGPVGGGQMITVTGSNFSNGNKQYKQISAGTSHTCAVATDNTAYCWGLNTNGRTGFGVTSGNQLTPRQISTIGSSVASISAGNSETCAVTTEGAAYCWGYGYYGGLGTGASYNNAERSLPTAVDTTGVLAGKTITSISTGGVGSNGFTCAIASDQQAYCWGYGGSGQMGNGTTTNMNARAVAVDTTGALAGKTVKAITTGNTHTCVIASDDQVYCWGGTFGARPALISGGALEGKTVRSISAGNASTCVVASDDRAYCWGTNTNGQLGNGTTTNSGTTPVAVDTTGVLAGKKIASVTAGNGHACAVSTEGKLYCWGLNSSGQLGDGSGTGSTVPVPVELSGALADEKFVAVHTGADSTCAITAEGEGYCWGLNTNGQLGDDSLDSAQLPIAITPVAIRPLQVTFGGTEAQKVDVISSNEIRVTTPAHGAGLVDFEITRYDDDSILLSDVYEYMGEPELTSVTPNTSLVSGGDMITIHGENFRDGMTVTVGGSKATDVTVVNETTATAVVPGAAAPGKVSILIEDIYGQQSTLHDSFTYLLPAPTFTSITPNITRAGYNAGTAIITGSGFVAKDDNTTWYTVQFGDTTATGVTVIDDTTLQVNIPVRSTAGQVDITIGGEFVTSTTAADAFIYTASGFSFSNPRLDIATNEAGQLTIEATTISNVDTVIALDASTETGQFAIDLNENEATRWSHDSVVLPAGQKSVNVWYKDTVSGAPTITGSVAEGLITFTQVETITSNYRLQVTGVSDPIAAGVPSSVTVRAVDRNGNPVRDYAGTFSFSSTDADAVLPSDFTMTIEDRGVKTFTNGVTLKSPGEHCVTATDTTDPVITGSQCDISVRSPNTGAIEKLAIVTPPQSIPVDTASAPITVQTQGEAGAIPVTVDTPLYVTTDSPTMSLSVDGETWSSESPYIVTVPAGSSSINLYVRDSTSRTSTLRVSDLSTDTSENDSGWSNASQQVITGVGAADRLVIEGTDTLLVGQKGTYSVKLKDSENRTVSALRDYQVTLDVDTETGTFYLDDESDGVAEAISLIIPTGYSEVVFELSDTTVSIGSEMTTVIATDDGGTLSPGQLDIQIIATLPASTVIVPDQTSIESGHVVPVTLQLLDENDQQTYASSTMSFTLSTSSNAGSYSFTENPFVPVNSVSLQRGEGTKQLYYRDTRAGTASLRATRPGTAAMATPITVVSSDAYRLGVTPPSQTAELNKASSAYTVTAYDVYGNVVVEDFERVVYVMTGEESVDFAAEASGPWGAASVAIPAGQSTAQFYARGTEFLENPASIVVSDEATVGDSDTGLVNTTASFAVTSQEIDSIEFTTSPHTITAGGVTASITIVLKQADGSPAIQNGTTRVSVSVSEGKIMLSPDATASGVGSVLIPENASTATFYYTAERSGNHTINVINGTASARQDVHVDPGVAAVLNFVTPPKRLPVGQTSTAYNVGVLDEYGNATSFGEATQLRLTSSCEGDEFSESVDDWQAIDTIEVSGGSTQLVFYYKAAMTGSCTISVSAPDLDADTQSVTVTTVGPFSLAVRGPTTIVKGQDAIYGVDILDEAGNVTAATSDITVQLATSSGTGELSAQTLRFHAGDMTRTFHYTDTASRSVTLSATDQSAGLMEGTLDVEVTHGDAARLRLSPTTSTIRAGEGVELTANLVNEYGQTVEAIQPTTITLTSADATGIFYEDDTRQDSLTTITIPVGQSEARFYYTQTQSGTATIRAVSDDLLTGSANVTVLPATVAAIDITNQPYAGSRALEIGQHGEFAVALLDEYGNRTTAPGDVTLYVESSDAAGALSDDGVVTIPAGQTSQTFTYMQNHIGAFTLTVSDSYTGDDGAFESVSQEGEVILGRPAAYRFQDSSISLERGAVSQRITVELLNSSGSVVPAPAGGQRINLRMAAGTGTFSLDINGEFGETLEATVPEGETQLSFYYRNDDGRVEQRSCSVVNGNRECETTMQYVHTIVAYSTTPGSMDSDSMRASLYYGDPVRYVIITPPREQQANKPTGVMTVQRQNQYGKEVPLYQDSTIQISTSSPDTGSFASSKITWDVDTLTILDSESSADFYYKDSKVGQPEVTITPVAHESQLFGDSQIVTITEGVDPPAPAAALMVTNISDPQEQGTPSSVVVIAIDAEGFMVDSYDGTISFSSDDPEAIIPGGSYTFDPEVDKGSKTFTNQVAFSTPGEKIVTATDTNGLTGSQTDITVLGANTNPVAAVVFSNPSSPVSLSAHEVSPMITVSLLDAEGRPTVAPSGGFTVRLTATATSGVTSLSPDGSDWRSNRTVTIPAGLSFTNVYYKVAEQKTHELHVSDWQEGVDQAAISNDMLHIVMDDDSTDPSTPQPPQPEPVTPPEGVDNDNEGGDVITPDGDDRTEVPSGTQPEDDGVVEDGDGVLPSGGGSMTHDRTDAPEEGGMKVNAASIAAGAAIIIVILSWESVRHVLAIHKLRDMIEAHHVQRSLIASQQPLTEVVRSPFLSLYFWLPIVASVVISVAATILITRQLQGVQYMDLFTAVTLVLATLTGVVLFVWLHSHHLQYLRAAVTRFFTVNRL